MRQYNYQTVKYISLMALPKNCIFFLYPLKKDWVFGGMGLTPRLYNVSRRPRGTKRLHLNKLSAKLKD